jgi:AcrR family transcriptional regulator
MPARVRLGISELSARTGVPAATIHHYLRQGLLPVPLRVARNRFLYDGRHVRRLRLVRALRTSRGLSLDAIRAILPRLAGLEEADAFRPAMWDRLLERRSETSRRRAPATRLLDAATAAFARYGYDEVNVEDICRRAGIAKGSFYRLYPSKQDLFFAAARGAAAGIAAGLPPPIGTPRRSSFEERLATLLAPHLPLFLDLLTRGLQGRPGYRDAGRAILGGLAAEVGRAMGASPPRAQRLGAEVLAAAVSRAARDAFLEGPAVRSLLSPR